MFIAPEGDHFRTRMTHTLEVTGISRAVARALRLNEDLTEAIALGHDLGHPPFGHTGEEALDRCLRDHGSEFHHNEHSVRVVEVLERDGRGLNLTAEVRDGIRHHTGSGRPATLEGAIVRLVDRFGYVNHDIDDAVRAGILDAGDLPAEPLRLLGATSSARVDALVHDLVETSDRAGAIEQSPDHGAALSELRRFMFEHVYLGPAGAGRERAGRRRGRGPLPSPPDRLGSRGGDRLGRRHDRPLCPAGAQGARLRRVSTITRESLEALEVAVDMVDLIGARTPLRRSGARYVGRCPFHDERTPSFSVDPVKKVYYCFGCQRGGDHIAFVRETESLDFAAAVETLADRYGVRLEYEQSSPADERRRAEQRPAPAPPGRCGRLLLPVPVGVGRGGARADVPRGAGDHRGDRPRPPARLRAVGVGPGVRRGARARASPPPSSARPGSRDVAAAGPSTGSAAA